MRASIHYVNGQEVARFKLGLAVHKLAYDITPSPDQLKMLAKYTAGGALGGAAAGGLTAGEGHRGEGAMRGGLMGGGLLGGAAALGTVGGNALGRHMTRDMDPDTVNTIRKQVDQGLLGQSDQTTGLMGLLGAGIGASEGLPLRNDAQPKLAFMGFDPAAMKHIGMRAAGGAAAGAGIGAVAGGEDNRMSGALAGGAMGGLAAGGASMARKAPLALAQPHIDDAIAHAKNAPPGALNMLGRDEDFMRVVQGVRNNQHRINQGITGAGAGRTMAGGAAMGALPAMAAGRMTRDE